MRVVWDRAAKTGSEAKSRKTPTTVRKQWVAAEKSGERGMKDQDCTL
jgi:hypothetical protein